MILHDISILLVVSTIYILILFFVAPVVDHAFTPLHKEETNLEIFFEIIIQILTVATIWFILNKYINIIINKYINIKNMRSIELSLSIVSGLVFVGLQTHLQSKLHYITKEHPFRILRLFND
tara:strand:- start:16 stop:381 length:366 start_codon:yes stop_codon:yes gene_type:complete